MQSIPPLAMQMGVLCKQKNNLKHFPRVESAIHEMKIEYTTVEMFWKEKNTIFSAFIANICHEKKKNCLKLKKLQRDKKKSA
ncbi:MAG: hypothetical protein ACOH2V_01805 [Candidatus Saccharimonadaceae bacterium]